MKIIVSTLVFLYFSICLTHAQINTNTAFGFLKNAQTARSAALGGYAIQEIGADVNNAVQNSSLLNLENEIPISLSHQFILSGASLSNITVGLSAFKNKVDVLCGIQTLNYGTIVGYDINGGEIGKINASDNALYLGIAYQLFEQLRTGLVSKFIFSNYGSYKSNALSLDFCASLIPSEKNTELGLLIKNVGFQLKTFNGSHEPLPIDVQLAGSIKLAHLPLRLGLVIHSIQKWELRYENPYNVNNNVSIDDPFAKPEAIKYGFIDNLFRHFIVQSEFTLGSKKGFKVRAGYNHFRKRELSVNNLRSLSGFSMGLGLRISKFNFDYSYQIYHLAGGAHFLTLGTNLSSFKKAKL